MKYTEKEVKEIVANFVTEWNPFACQWDKPEDVLKDINSGKTPVLFPKRKPLLYKNQSFCELISFYSYVEPKGLKLFTFIKCDTEIENIFYLKFAFESFFLVVNNKVLKNHSSLNLPFLIDNSYSYKDFKEYFDIPELRNVII